MRRIAVVWAFAIACEIANGSQRDEIHLSSQSLVSEAYSWRFWKQIERMTAETQSGANEFSLRKGGSSGGKGSSSSGKSSSSSGSSSSSSGKTSSGWGKSSYSKTYYYGTAGLAYSAVVVGSKSLSPRGTFTQKSSSNARTYYNGATFTARTPSWSRTPLSRSRIRPYYIVPIYARDQGQSVATCSTNTFRFGSECRPCSSDPCPVGQYRYAIVEINTCVTLRPEFHVQKSPTRTVHCVQTSPMALLCITLLGTTMTVRTCPAMKTYVLLLRTNL
eukprot:760255-Hanusia_phi.AAC.1